MSNFLLTTAFIIIYAPAIFFLCVMLLIISAERARSKARKWGGRAPYEWWLYRRHICHIEERIIGPAICLLKGHDHWKMFMWEMGSPGESYLQGHCRRCGGIHDVEHPIPMSANEQLAWIEDNYPDIKLIHLGDHSWGSVHVKGQGLRSVSVSGGKVTEEKPPEYGLGKHGRIDCFWNEYQPERKLEEKKS